jgi:acyl-coenzyme A thioesterase PaaI-like protein
MTDLSHKIPEQPLKPAPDGFEPITSSSLFGFRNGPLFERKSDDGQWARGFWVDDKHLNGAEVLHGGMLMVFADIVMGRGVADDFDPPFVTVRLATDFISPALKGFWLEGSARVTGEQDGLVNVVGEFTSRGKIIGTATAVFKLLKPKKTS